MKCYCGSTQPIKFDYVIISLSQSSRAHTTNALPPVYDDAREGGIIPAGKAFKIQVPALGEVQLVGMQEREVSIVSPGLWNALPRKAHLALSSHCFRRVVKRLFKTSRQAFNLVD